jgi:hypothetical protein
MEDKEKCESCRHDLSADNFIRCGVVLCRDCHAEEHASCRVCENCDNRNNLVELRQGYGCSDCMEEYSECQNCSHIISDDGTYQNENDDTVCEDCYNGSDILGNSRNYGRLVACDKGGTIVKSMRPFGVEIELYTDHRQEMTEIMRALPQGIGYGPDGSISGAYTLEVRTAPLQGKHGEELIKKVCKLLNDHNAQTNKSCGLHVHLDGMGYGTPTNVHSDNTALRRLWATYYAIEDILLAMLPQSRRGNHYCDSLKYGYHLREILDEENDIEKVWYRLQNRQEIQRAKGHGHHDSRYRGLNLHSFFSRGNFEVRFHSGTTNAEKILHWTALHQYIVDNASGLFNAQVLDNILGSPFIDQKVQMFLKQYKIPAYLARYMHRRIAHFRTNAATNTFDVLARQEEEALLA